MIHFLLNTQVLLQAERFSKILFDNKLYDNEVYFCFKCFTTKKAVKWRCFIFLIMLNFSYGLPKLRRPIKLFNVMAIFDIFFHMLSSILCVITLLTYQWCRVFLSFVLIQSILGDKYNFTLITLESYFCMFSIA